MFIKKAVVRNVWASFSLLISQVLCSTRSSGIRVQLNQNLIDYSKGVLLDKVSNATNQLQVDQIAEMPDDLRSFTFRKGIFSFQVSKMVISRVEIPETFADAQIQNDGFLIKASRIQTSIEGKYYMKLGFIKKSGTINIYIDDSNLKCFIKLKMQANGRLHAKTFKDDCEAVVEELRLKFSGNVLDYIINWFKSPISDLAKKQMNGLIKDRLADFINQALDKFSNEIPSQVELTDNYSLNTSIQNLVFDNHSLVVDINGQVFFVNDTTDSNVDAAEIEKNELAKSKKMVSAAISEFPFNSLGEALWRSGLLNQSLDRKKLESLKAGTGKYMATACKIADLCIGLLVPKIKSKWPNSPLIITMTTSKAPHFHLNHSGIYLHFETELEFLAVTETTNRSSSIFRMAVGIDVRGSGFKLEKIENKPTNWYKISGSVQTTSNSTELLSSDIDGLTVEDVKGIWGLVAFGYVDQTLNESLQKGYTLPREIPYVEAKDVNLDFAENALLADTNLLLLP